MLGVDLKPILGTLEEFKGLQTELIDAINENSSVQREVLAELKRLNSGTLSEALLG